MQADIAHRFVLLAQLEQRLKSLARLRAAALYGLVLGAMLLLFAGAARPAQPLLPWITGALLGGTALPLLLVSQLLFHLRQDAHRGLVRQLFRQGYRADYPEFNRTGDAPTTLRLEPHARPTP
ncbi:MAG: hypothetical protein RIC38_12740 [Chromatocurvus sp.]